MTVIFRRVLILYFVLSMTAPLTVPATAQAAQTTPGQGDFSWIDYEGDGLSLRVPSTWLGLNNTGGIEDALESARQNNPALVPLFEQAEKLLSSNSISLFLIDVVSQSNLNMAKLPSGGVSYTLEALQAAVPAQYESLGINLIDTMILDLPVGEVLRIHAGLSFNQGTGSQVDQVEQLQYFILEGSDIYVVTFTSPQAGFATAEPVFNRIANTIQIEASENGWTRYTSFEDLLTLDVPSDWTDLEIAIQGDFILTLTRNAGEIDASVKASATETPLDDLEGSMTDQLDAQGVKIISVERVYLPAGEFILFDVVHSDLPDPIEQYQYVTVYEGNQITVTFTAKQDDFASVAPLFMQSIDTLRFNQVEA
jgi:hypothetical protein